MKVAWPWLLTALLFTLTGCQLRRQFNHSASSRGQTPEQRAVAFLAHEAPRWPRENKCFSCHNNGDAARALYVAATLGYRVPQAALAETTAWLRKPEHWDDNKGDPAFSDKRLARIQFTAALASAVEARQIADRPIQRAAAKRLIDEQHPDGAWHIEPDGTLGSPATYGTALATALAINALAKLTPEDVNDSRRKAEHWLRNQTLQNNVLDAAAILIGLRADRDAEASNKQQHCFDLLRRAQKPDGGWGPYPDSPPEAFDTAVVLLAITGIPEEPDNRRIIERGRKFLLAEQLADGSWPETTRPTGSQSYAQHISTTGWATLALLRTGPPGR